MTPNLTIHLIPNAHLDPVWLWDWREGFTEAVTTTRTILDLMDEFPELTFIRGEAFIYRFIEQNDPPTFERIREMIRAGRWDVVGGTMLQSDMNLPATETMLRNVALAQRYFADRLGTRARVGWSADCFGHAAPLPDLLAAGGLEYYAYTRSGPLPPENTFWWEGPAGARLLVHHPTVGWYGMERDEMPRRLDGLLELASAGTGSRNLPALMGLGDHGGHPTRRMIAEARRWAEAHHDVRVVYSTMTRFFDALRDEVGADGAPVFRGELNFAPRGVYAANARFKFAYRKAEAAVLRAERVSAAVAAAAAAAAAPPADLREAWEAVLFNTFHDILPGSSIERCYDEQHDWLGLAPHRARQAEQGAYLALSARVDTTVRPPAGDMPAGVPVLAFNPHPWPFQGVVELEAGLDYRPIWKYTDHPADLPVTLRGAGGDPLPLQVIPAENLYLPELNIRTRAVFPLSLPPMGWQVLEYAYDEGADPCPPAGEAVQVGEDRISNGIWEVQAELGAEGVRLLRGGKPVLDEPGLGVLTVEDPWGVWGDFHDSPPSLSLTEVRQRWKITRVAVGETGPLRASLNVRMQAGGSRIDLCFLLASGQDWVDARARPFWDERSARLKLDLPGGFTGVVYDVVGGQVQRGAVGEVPGGRWVRMEGGAGPLGFASDALYGFNLTPEGSLHASVVRATRYAAEGPAAPDEQVWAPVLDSGPLRFQFRITARPEDLPRLAAELEQPPLLSLVTASPGGWPRTGSLLALDPSAARLLALKPAEDGAGWVVRVQSTVGEVLNPTLNWQGRPIALPALPPYAVATYRLLPGEGGQWELRASDLLEG